MPCQLPSKQAKTRCCSRPTKGPDHSAKHKKLLGTYAEGKNSTASGKPDGTSESLRGVSLSHFGGSANLMEKRRTQLERGPHQNVVCTDVAETWPCRGFSKTFRSCCPSSHYNCTSLRALSGAQAPATVPKLDLLMPRPAQRRSPSPETHALEPTLTAEVRTLVKPTFLLLELTASFCLYSLMSQYKTQAGGICSCSLFHLPQCPLTAEH